MDFPSVHSKPSTVEPEWTSDGLPSARMMKLGASPNRYRPAPSPEVVGDQPEIFGYLKVSVDRNAAARLGEVLLRSKSGRLVGIEGLHRIEHPGDFKMHARIGIESDFADDVRMHLGEADTIDHVGIQFGGSQAAESRRQRRDAATAGAAEILRSVLGRNAPGNFVVRVVEETEAGDAAPSQPVEVVHVKFLPIKQISRQR